MKIVKEGNPDKLKPTYRSTCSNCDCVFEFKKSELKTYYPDHRNGYDPREKSYSYIECPTCNNRITEFNVFPSPGNMVMR